MFGLGWHLQLGVGEGKGERLVGGLGLRLALGVGWEYGHPYQ